MTAKQFKGKAIYNPSGKAGEYSKWACNFYTGCSNDCSYCYCKRGVMSSVWSTEPKLKSCFRDEEHALELFEKELKQNLSELREHGLFFSFTTDPLIEDTWEMTLKATKICMNYDVPVKILTKYTKCMRKFLRPDWLLHKDKIAIGFTLTGHDELEPTSSNQLRIETMKILHGLGYKLFASIEPIIDFDSSWKMIEDTLGFCDLYKIGLQSSKRYDRTETFHFMCRVIQATLMKSDAKVYFKDGMFQKSQTTRELFNQNISVTRDYNLFKK